MTTKGFAVDCAISRTYKKHKTGASGSNLRHQKVYMGEEEYVYRPAFTSFTLTGGSHFTPAEIRKRPVYRLITHKRLRG